MLKILVVSHDSGGANILSSLINKYRSEFQWIIYVSGPAKNIFLSKKIDKLTTSVFLRKREKSRHVLNKVQPDLVLTGTGWESDSNRKFIECAKRNNIKTASFLDHWSYYRERFGYPKADWNKNLPDFVFVGDQMAYKTAIKEKFPKNILIKVENPYFEEIKIHIKTKKQNRNDEKDSAVFNMLYLSDPIYKHGLKRHGDASHWGYTEYEAVKILFKAINANGGKQAVNLKIRLHPAENRNKYSNFLKEGISAARNKKVSISNPKTVDLLEDCLWADVVIGHESMALVVAFMAGKKTISYVPHRRQSYFIPPFIQVIHNTDSLIKELRESQKQKHGINHNNAIDIVTNKRLFARAIKRIFKFN